MAMAEVIMTKALQGKLASGTIFMGHFLPIDEDHPLHYLLNEEEERMVSIDDWLLIKDDGEISEEERIEISGLIELGLTDLVLSDAD